MGGLWGILEWVGRIVFGGFFLMSGVNHFINMKGYTGYAQSKRLPAAGAAVAVSGLMLLAGGASILVRWHSGIGAILLILFLVPAALFIHNFWTETDPMMKANQQAHFGKNLALAGAALLYLVAHWRGSL